jgi:mannitol/fructose-specific phosphotransferase system IIA component (Ntr-type)
MKSLLDALQEGRLVELSETNKDKALEYLALLVEAIPDIGTQMDIVKEVKEREAQSPTGIGKGVAVPHVRTDRTGELLCAVGWSPQGIAYGAPDGRDVHLLVMYYVPDTQRPLYLKEVSGLAKALQKTDGIEPFADIHDIQAVRHKLLDWVGLSIDEAVPDAKARMIKLEARQAAVASVPAAARASYAVQPFRVLADEAGRALVLSDDPRLVAALESSPELRRVLSGEGGSDIGRYKIALYGTTRFALNRTLFEGVAVAVAE